MVKLVVRSPAHGLLPLKGGGIEVSEAEMVQITSVAPLTTGLSDALAQAHRVNLPTPGTLTQTDGTLCAWFGRGHYLLIGAAADVSLTAHAALTDQSDAWCRVSVTGARVAEMLSYLTPVDLRDAAFPPGSATRAQIGHMNAAILRTGAQTFELMVFRSMAATLVHELKDAIRSLP